MVPVVPCAALVRHIAPFFQQGKTGLPPFSCKQAMRSLCAAVVHAILSGQEGVFFDTSLYLEFAKSGSMEIVGISLSILANVSR